MKPQTPIPQSIIPISALSISSTDSSTSTSSSVLATSSFSSDNDKFTIGSISKNNQGSGRNGGNSNSSSNSSSNMRELCSDRKAFFSHFQLRSLIISSCRVSILQATQIATSYLTDQLEHETNLEEQLVLGEITPLELDRLTTSWENTEWDKRWKSLYPKVWTAIGKFHLLTIFMRCYETLFSVLVNDDYVLDMLTKDTFRSAKRKSQRLDSYLASNSNSNGNNSHDSESSSSWKITYTTSASDDDDINNQQHVPAPVTSRGDLGRQMFKTCLYANAISFLADHTVQQCIIAYGYYVYWSSKRRERRLARLMGMADGDGDGELKLEEKEKDNDGGEDEGEDDDEKNDSERSENSVSAWMEGETGGMVLSFFYKSAQVTVSRSIGLFMASFGGSIGSMIYPGWGTLFGTQAGDAVVGALLD